MNKLPNKLAEVMFDKNNVVYSYTGYIKPNDHVDEYYYMYSTNSTSKHVEHVLISDNGRLMFCDGVGYLYKEKQNVWVEGAEYLDEKNRKYTLVKDGRNDPNFTNKYVKLIFLDSEGKVKARDANGKSLTPTFSIASKL